MLDASCWKSGAPCLGDDGMIFASSLVWRSAIGRGLCHRAFLRLRSHLASIVDVFVHDVGAVPHLTRRRGVTNDDVGHLYRHGTMVNLCDISRRFCCQRSYPSHSAYGCTKQGPNTPGLRVPA